MSLPDVLPEDLTPLPTSQGEAGLVELSPSSRQFAGAEAARPPWFTWPGLGVPGSCRLGRSR
jgi:hypothetical protein